MELKLELDRNQYVGVLLVPGSNKLTNDEWGIAKKNPWAKLLIKREQLHIIDQDFLDLSMKEQKAFIDKCFDQDYMHHILEGNVNGKVPGKSVSLHIAKRIRETKGLKANG